MNLLLIKIQGHELKTCLIKANKKKKKSLKPNIFVRKLHNFNFKNLWRGLKKLNFHKFLELHLHIKSVKIGND